MRLAVIILSYNTRDLLRQSLTSVLASAALTADRLAVDVLVVDNASHDGSPAMVAAEFPQVYLLASDKNLGYTGGNNLGMARLGFDTAAARSDLRDLTSDRFLMNLPDFVLLLNADAEVKEDALWQMAHFLAEYPGAGACGAHLRYGSGDFQHGAFALPNLFQVALDFFPMTGWPGAHQLHNSLLNGRYPDLLWQGDQPFPVDFVLGAAIMVRREVILQVGGLDDAFFMYCEEMDWCLRMEEAGWGIFAVPTAQVIHHEGQSSKQVRWPAFIQLWRSRFRFYAKHERIYSRQYVQWVRGVVRAGLWLRERQAHQRFALGAITGTQLAEELAAYALLKRM
ncbi:MAG: glycosyltransferase family 2 protein [Caldilineaceae bacterium]|nr:glycosyltransferase family 2 protein [Caldilineaceae bacterium]